MSKINLLDSAITADGASAWKDIAEGGDYVFQVPSTATLGGGTLSFQTADSDSTQAVQDTANLDFTAAPAPTVITLGAGMRVRLSITGSTTPSIPSASLYKAHS